MREFDVMRKLWLQVRIALLKRVFIKEENKWIQVFIIGSADPAAVIQYKTIFIAYLES